MSLVSNQNHNTEKTVIAILGLWALAVMAFAQFGVYRLIDRPYIAFIIALGIIAPFLAYLLIDNFNAYVKNIGLRPLTLFHIWRIPAAFVFFWYDAHQLLPGALGHNAGWGDLLSGSVALALVFLPERRVNYWVFHIIGFADFLIAVTTGLILTLQGDPRMAAVISLPLALIPLYGVGITGATHLMAFSMLLSRSPKGRLSQLPSF